MQMNLCCFFLGFRAASDQLVLPNELRQEQTHCRCISKAVKDEGGFAALSLSLHQSQHHEDEKRALSREIIVLNNHLMEAKLTIDKLQEDNVRHRLNPNRRRKLTMFKRLCTLRSKQLIFVHKRDAAPLQELYRKDCNLAAQLLHCDKSLYRAQLSEVSSELSAGLQIRPEMHVYLSPYYTAQFEELKGIKV